jgi:protein gp37
MKNSKIEWTHHTFNPWWGCERVSPACKHCYAEALAHRFGQDVWGKSADRRWLSDSYWRQPLAWDRQAQAQRKRYRVFCASMADVFEDRRDLDPWRERLWRLIEKTPRLDWLLLTKRPECVLALAPWGDRWPPNVWLGATIENQKWAERRAPVLVQIPASVRFVSCEPLLGPVNLTPWLRPERGNAINWVIAGGESGHHARPTSPEWLESLRDQCRAHGAAFHFKQWGNWLPVPASRLNGHRSRTMRSTDGEPIHFVNVGKKAAGRQLDGREWNQLPGRGGSTGGDRSTQRATGDRKDR